jgi:hypothetical protein
MDMFLNWWGVATRDEALMHMGERIRPAFADVDLGAGTCRP